MLLKKAFRYVKKPKALLKRIQKESMVLCHGKTPMEFITLEQLLSDSEKLASLVKDTDLVIGIPRSGLLPAVHLTNEYDVPLSTPSLVCKNRLVKPNQIVLGRLTEMVQQGLPDSSFAQMLWDSSSPMLSNENKAILLDDSTNIGDTMTQNYHQLKSRFTHLTRAAIYVTREYKEVVDVYVKTASRKRITEWNMSIAEFGRTLSDLDGVLCEDGTDNPLLIPKFRLEAIVTQRPQARRKETIQWLMEHSVLYSALFMECNVEKKAEIAKHLKPQTIFESSFENSKELWVQTRTPVICFDKKCIFS
jgi:hypoxanthine phosphoribosyltransferase